MADSDNTDVLSIIKNSLLANKKYSIMAGIVVIAIVLGLVMVLMTSTDEEPIEPKPIDTHVELEQKPVQQPIEPPPQVAVDPQPLETIEDPQTVLEVEPQPISPPRKTPVQPKVVLPSLADSDQSLLTELTQTLWHKDFTALFVSKDIIRRFVVFTDNIASGTMLRDRAMFKPPIGRFRVIETEQETLIDGQSYQRYDVYLAVIASADPQQMVELYRKYTPLIKAAYAEIGYPDHNFTDTLIQAIDHVLETPVIDGHIELVTPHVMYQFKQEELQELTHVQRQMLRLGPQNMRKLQPILRRYRSLLANL